MLSAGVQPDNELLTRRRLLMFPHRKPDSQEARSGVSSCQILWTVKKGLKVAMNRAGI